MKMISLGLGFALSFMLSLPATAQQNLDPVFQITSVNGNCRISLPGEATFAEAEENRAYPYGSRIQTGPRSSLLMRISDGNTVRVLANADVVFNEDTSNSKIKNVQLHSGEVEVQLNRDFHDGGNQLNVETATAICGAIGTHFRVASRMEQDLRVVVIRVLRGKLHVYGENFEVGEMGENQWLSLLSPPDRSFMRMKSMKGNFSINVKEADMSNREIPLNEGMVVNLWQLDVPESNQRIITVAINAANGEQLDTFTIIFEEGEVPFFGEPGAAGWREAPTSRRRPAWRREAGDNPLPPDDFIDELIDRVIDDVNVDFRPAPGPRPPRPPSPTPVGRR